MNEAELKIARECPLCEPTAIYPITEKSLERHKKGFHYVKGGYIQPGPRHGDFKKHLEVMDKLAKLIT